MTPRATARLQLHADFPLDAAHAQLDYYAALGVSHLYLSPITQARPGSMHGYDVLDPTCISSELGGDAAFERLAEAAIARGMGLILDIVPNHMAADARNPWWRDVLRQGRNSPYADYFDINWAAQSGKILLPILPVAYGNALRTGEIRLDKQDSVPVIIAGGQVLPVSGMPDPLALMRYGEAPTQPDSIEFLHTLLEQQHYRLAWWRAAADQLNWRRFFEVSELIGIRVEDPTVFNAVHALPLSLYQRGLIDGLRLDHIDGLAEPGAYLRHLRQAMLQSAPSRTPYIVVEKILAPQEALDARWPIDGTSGYDFLDDAGALLHSQTAHRPLLDCWQQNGGDPTPIKLQLQQIRSRLLARNLVSERRTALAAWSRLTEASSEDGPAWDRVISAWLAAFPVYRSYAEDGGPSEADQTYWEDATREARNMLDDADHPRLTEFATWLRDPPEPDGRSALKRLQQVTPALAAKSLEDTLYYRHGALLSRNEVGAWPQRFALEPEEFHARNAWRARHAPATMLATATHDHKRGEDARARLAVITEIPEKWAKQSAAWLAQLPENALSHPDRYMLLQSLIGAWPAHWTADLDQLDPGELDEWLTRIRAWQRKALREAKQHTSWTEIESEYEDAGQACIDLLDPQHGDTRLLQTLATLAQSLVEPGHINSLTQTLLRNTAPGVPDLYQGTDLWDYSLVDPDNRRPVDYEHRRTLLTTASLARPRTSHWRSGAVKQMLIRTALQLRRAQPTLFDGAAYQPVYASGPRANHVVAYLRQSERAAVLVVAPRLCAWQLAGYARDESASAATFWQDTTLRLPAGQEQEWLDLLGQREVKFDAQGEIQISALLEHWPVALCSTSTEPLAMPRPSTA